MKNRYFKREWEESYYIFDSEVITEKEVDEAIQYDNDVFSKSMQGEEVIDRLNYLQYQNDEALKLIDEGVELGREKKTIGNQTNENPKRI